MNSSDTDIAVKATYNNVSRESSIRKSSLRDPKDLKSLISSIFPEIPLNCDSVIIKRKSKRSKKYITVTSHSDFKSLKRSLDVKNHLRLRINDVPGSPDSSADDTTITESKSSNNSAFNEKLDSIINKVDTLTSAFKSQTIEQPPSSPPSTPSVFIHEGVFCDNCYPTNVKDMKCIEGNRYKCSVCYDFDLCEACFNNKVNHEGHRPYHPMILSDGANKKQVDGIQESSVPNNNNNNNNNNDDDTIRVTESVPQVVDHFIDIPITDLAYSETMIDFVSKFNTAGQIMGLIKNNERYIQLIRLLTTDSNGDASDSNYEILYQTVKATVEKDRRSQLVSTNPELTSQIAIQDDMLILHLTNKSDGLTPNNMLLKFTCLSESKELIRFNLNFNEPLLSSNGVKVFRHNLYGLNVVNVSQTNYTVELINNDEVYASGACLDGSGFAFLNNAELNVDLLKFSPTNKNRHEFFSTESNSKVLTTNNNSLDSVVESSLSDSVLTLQDTFIAASVSGPQPIVVEEESTTSSDFTAAESNLEEVPPESGYDTSTTEDFTDGFIEVSMNNIITEDDESNDSSGFTEVEGYEVLSCGDDLTDQDF